MTGGRPERHAFSRVEGDQVLYATSLLCDCPVVPIKFITGPGGRSENSNRVSML